MRFVLAAALVAVIGVSACATRPAAPKEAGGGETFVIERDLLGKTVGRGEFRAITGVKRGFTAYLDGSWDGTRLTLVEDFEFDDGEKDRKTWVLTRTAPGEYAGVREDVVGQARAFADDNGLRLEYKARLPAKDGGEGRVVMFRDILVKTPEGVVLNRATVGYYGLRVGSVDLKITRE